MMVVVLLVIDDVTSVEFCSRLIYVVRSVIDDEDTLNISWVIIDEVLLREEKLIWIFIYKKKITNATYVVSNTSPGHAAVPLWLTANATQYWFDWTFWLDWSR